MRKLIVVLVTAIIVQLGMPYAHACGDKTMRVRNGVRSYQREIANHPATILILSAALPNGKAAVLRKFLNDVGHKATAIDDVRTVKDDLKTGQYDLVLTNLAEAPDLQREVASFTPKTVVVPVLFKQPKSDEKAAAHQYKVIVKNPQDGLDFLDAVSAAMKSQLKKS
jgi:hypothetical protein